MPKLLKRLLVSLTTLVVVFGVAELVLRWRQFDYPPLPPIQIWNREEDKTMRLGLNLHVESPRQLWIPDPGAEVPKEWAKNERINPDGYRGPLREKNKPPGVLRIATLGDSSTFGHSVEYSDTYSAQLEARLNAQGLRAEVIDGGVVGFTIRQGLERYQELIREFHPDYVIEAFGAVNDHLPALQGLIDKKKIAMHVELGGFWTQIAITVRSEVKLAHFFAWFTDSFHPERANERDRAFRMERFTAHLENNGMGAVDWKGQRRVPLDDFEACLLELQRLVETDGGHLILVSMPRQPSIERDSPVLAEYSKTIADVAQRQHLPFVDARQLFANALAAGKPVQELFADSYHPKPVGHQMIADALATVIQEAVRSSSH